MGDEYVPGQDYWGDVRHYILNSGKRKTWDGDLGDFVDAIDMPDNWQWGTGASMPGVGEATNNSFLGGVSDWFGDTFENFGGKDGWGGTAIAAGQFGLDAWLGMNKYKLAEDALALNKQARIDRNTVTDKNFNTKRALALDAQNVMQANSGALGVNWNKSPLPDNLQLA